MKSVYTGIGGGASVEKGQKLYGTIQNEFDESKHPRADDGKFGSGGGTSESSESSKPAKKRIAGKLKPAGDWKVSKSYHVDDTGGHSQEGKSESCAHCGKSIKSCVDISGSEGDFTVGADCAEALLSGEAKSKVESFAKSEKLKTTEINKTVKTVIDQGYNPIGKNRDEKVAAIKKLEKESGGDLDSKEFAKALSVAVRKALNETNDKFKWFEHV